MFINCGDNTTDFAFYFIFLTYTIKFLLLLGHHLLHSKGFNNTVNECCWKRNLPCSKSKLRIPSDSCCAIANRPLQHILVCVPSKKGCIKQKTQKAFFFKKKRIF